MTSVLIVDDHPSLRLILKQQVSQILGVSQIIEAGNGQEALQAVRDSEPGLVILDIDLPKINGLDAIPRIKLIKPDIRILVISAQDPRVFAPRVKAAGAQGYISKVQEMSEILRAIEAVLAGYSIFPDIVRSPGERRLLSPGLFEPASVVDVVGKSATGASARPPTMADARPPCASRETAPHLSSSRTPRA